ncbi:MAG TPA: DM13 domain-containing protein, partial [Ilumatobacteraceae bacterium]|nr:DM13 domain-containing protein [Ilumatobacteraceae bacterium]
AALIAAVMLVLVLIEPNILEAPFENERTLLFTFGGTALAALAFVAMLRLRVPVAIRVIVLVVPFVIVSWWLISPYFIDDVVDEDFTTSISEQVVSADGAPAVAPPPEVPLGDAPVTSSNPIVDDLPTQEQPPAATEPSEQVVTADGAPAVAPPPEVPLADAPVTSSDQTVEGVPAQEEPRAAAEPTEQEPPPPPPNGPVLLGAGRFVGLAGHSGTGDAGIFQNSDGSLVLRFENFAIGNGPDLEVYLVPGPDQISLREGSIHLGALKGNIGDQNYELPAGTELAPGAYTALVWCEAFSVEFVGATVVI